MIFSFARLKLIQVRDSHVVIPAHAGMTEE